MVEPAKYPSGREFVTFGEVNGDSRAEYFARYMNASLGRTKNLYMKWARISNAMSPECQQLNRLFSQCVDGNFIRIPENLKEFLKLEDPPEPSSLPKVKRDTLKFRTKGFDEGYKVTQSTIRVDSDLCGQLKTGDHVLLMVSNPPQNAPLTKAYSMDAIVITFDAGSVTFRCLHEPPSYVRECAWNITLRRSFVTSKTLIDVVTLFYSQRDVCCKIYDQILGKPHKKQAKLMNVELPNKRDSSLNESQNDALAASIKFALTFIWGPPGTGKTHTITVILSNLLVALPESRFLVTAPTHNAVDNLLRRFINDKKTKECGVIPVRVSTQVGAYSILFGFPRCLPLTNTVLACKGRDRSPFLHL
jgi:hypothetical protein